MPFTWYSIYDFSFEYKGKEQSFIKPDEFAWASELKANGHLIKDELFNYLSKHDLKSYFASSMVSRKNSWRTISLKTWSIELFKNQKDFPVTNALIKKYPQIIKIVSEKVTRKTRVIIQKKCVKNLVCKK